MKARDSHLSRLKSGRQIARADAKPPSNTMTFRCAVAAVALVTFTFCIPLVTAFLSRITACIQYRNFSLFSTKHPLVVSGETLLSLNDDALVSPAQALIQAGTAWTNDWQEVTYACADAAEAFRKLEGYETIADELQDLSEIEGSLRDWSTFFSSPSRVSLRQLTDCI